MLISVCPKAGGTIDVYSEYLYGHTLASFEIPPGDGKSFITLEAKVEEDLTGVLPIRMRFQGEADKDLFVLGGFSFSK